MLHYHIINNFDEIKDIRTEQKSKCLALGTGFTLCKLKVENSYIYVLQRTFWFMFEKPLNLYFKKDSLKVFLVKDLRHTRQVDPWIENLLESHCAKNGKKKDGWMEKTFRIPFRK